MKAIEILEMHFGSEFYTLKENGTLKHILAAMHESNLHVAEQVRRECAEKACIMVERNGKIISEKQLAFIAEDGDHLIINKQLIESIDLNQFIR